MKLNNLIETLCFHDGEIDNIIIEKKDIFIDFMLIGFLQNSTAKKFLMYDNVQNCYLKTQIKFSNYRNLQHSPDIDINNLSMDTYELWDVSYNELDDIFEIHLKSTTKNAISMITFSCDEAEITSCEIKQ